MMLTKNIMHDNLYTSIQYVLNIKLKVKRKLINNLKQFDMLKHTILIATLLIGIYCENCTSYTLGVAVTVTPGQQITCLSFPIHTPNHLELHFMPANPSNSINNYFVFFKLDKFYASVKTSIVFISQDGVESNCTGKSDCILYITIEKRNYEPLTVLVIEAKQPPEDSPVVFGPEFRLNQTFKVEQKGQKTAKYYMLVRKGHPVVLFLTSRSKTQYRITGLISPNENYNLSMFPSAKTQPSPNLFTSRTKHSGITSLIIPSSKLKCTEDCSIYIVVDVISNSDKLVSYRIESMDPYASLVPGKTQLGYVQKDSFINYEIPADDVYKIQIQINSFHHHCVNTEIFSREEQGQIHRVRQKSMDSHFVLPTDDQSKKYIVQVTGTSSCAFQITYDAARNRRFDIIDGVPLDLTLEKDEIVYLVYFHKSPEEFRILSLEPNAKIEMEMEPLLTQSANFNVNSNQFLIQAMNRRTFLIPIEGNSYTMSPKNKLFKAKIYYLVRIEAPQAVRTSILIHSSSSTVPMRAAHPIHQSLPADDYEQYTYHSPHSFQVSINMVKGKAKVSISKGLKNNVVLTKDVNKMQIIKVPVSLNLNNYIDGYDHSDEFVIKVQALSEPIEYDISIIGKDDSLGVLQKGVETEASVREKVCMQFTVSGKYSSLTLQSNRDINELTTSINLVVARGSSGSNNPAKFKQKRLKNKTQFDLTEAVSGDYELCLSSNSQSKIKILLSQTIPASNTSNRFTSLDLNQQLILTDSPVTLQYQPKTPIDSRLRSVMIEAYSCTAGDLTVIISNTSTPSNQVALKYDKASALPAYYEKKIGGEGFVLTVEKKGNSTDNDVLGVIKATLYEDGHFPYAAFKVDGAIQTQETKEELLVKIKRVSQVDQYFTIEKETYVVYLAGKKEHIRQAISCDTQPEVIQQSQEVNKTDKSTTITITLQKQQIEQLGISSGFINVVCELELTRKSEFQANSIRIPYKQTTVQLAQPEQQASEEQDQEEVSESGSRKSSGGNFNYIRVLIGVVAVAIVGCIILKCCKEESKDEIPRRPFEDEDRRDTLGVTIKQDEKRPATSLTEIAKQ